MPIENNHIHVDIHTVLLMFAVITDNRVLIIHKIIDCIFIYI